MVAWGVEAVALIKRIYSEQLEYHQAFASIDSSMLSLVRPDGAFEIYDGGLRARDMAGGTIFDHVDCNDYDQYLREGVKSWSYMKFPFIESLGAENGWYRVGPLARVNNCDYFDTPMAEQERVEFRAAGAGGAPLQATLAYHWARLIELLHCAEAIRDLLHDPDLLGNDLLVRGELQSRGIGVIEAPRGTLFHHYEIDADGIIEKCNLIVSTTNNNQAMNESIRQGASNYLDGRHLTEPLLNQIEVAIRAYDPCLSCATHALGRMPLEISLLDSSGELVERLVKSSSGSIHAPD
jgi:NAD-reducing hydrogenase large subunit